jgi:hypothetical protein
MKDREVGFPENQEVDVTVPVDEGTPGILPDD